MMTDSTENTVRALIARTRLAGLNHAVRAIHADAERVKSSEEVAALIQKRADIHRQALALGFQRTAEGFYK